MQNGIQDLFSLIKFLRHQPWSEPLWWNRVIKAPFEEGDEKAKGRLRAVLGPIILRRTKDTVDRTTGKAIVALPARNIRLHPVEFSSAEADFYKALYMRSKAELTGTLPRDAVEQLRDHSDALAEAAQACNHPSRARKGEGAATGTRQRRSTSVNSTAVSFPIPAWRGHPPGPVVGPQQMPRAPRSLRQPPSPRSQSSKLAGWRGTG